MRWTKLKKPVSVLGRTIACASHFPGIVTIIWGSEICSSASRPQFINLDTENVLAAWDVANHLLYEGFHRHDVYYLESIKVKWSTGHFVEVRYPMLVWKHKYWKMENWSWRKTDFTDTRGRTQKDRFIGAKCYRIQLAHHTMTSWCLRNVDVWKLWHSKSSTSRLS